MCWRIQFNSLQMIQFNSVQIIHQKIVDTALVFPHRLGLPYKRALKTLMGEFLQKIIQDSGKLSYFQFLCLTPFQFLCLILFHFFCLSFLLLFMPYPFSFFVPCPFYFLCHVLITFHAQPLFIFFTQPLFTFYKTLFAFYDFQNYDKDIKSRGIFLCDCINSS